MELVLSTAHESLEAPAHGPVRKSANLCSIHLCLSVISVNSTWQRLNADASPALFLGSHLGKEVVFGPISEAQHLVERDTAVPIMLF